MHIGDDTNFLRIDGSRIEASASGSGRTFTATHGAILMIADDGTKRDFDDFAEFKSSETKVKLTEGGWLHLSRDYTGAVTISYRIASWRAGGAMEGKVFVHGEFTNSFYADFRSLLHRWENPK